MSSKTVAILHDEIRVNARVDELDDLIQVEAVTGALTRLGYETVCFPFCIQGMGELAERLKPLNPLFAVNLVETVDRNSALCFTACAFLDSLGIKYTGNNAEAMFISTNKLITKRILRSFGLNTPDWVESLGDGTYLAGERYVIKPVSEEGSVGIHDSSLVFSQSLGELKEKIRRESTSTGRECFAERYIDGREFNISILGDRRQPKILPAAEILFIGYEERGLPKIVNYAAKWNADSYVYHHSVRSFTGEGKDVGLIAEINGTAKKCWHLLGLKGYVRIDFRVDDKDRPWVIDINANPCISVDSGFIAAAEKAGLAYDEVVRNIIREAGICFDI